MKQIVLPGSDIKTTPLAFGCASLFRTTSSAARQRLLHSAFEAGIRHFDVAPFYGLGAAEAELGKFVRGRRGDLVLATKFGLEVKKRTSWVAPVQSIGRSVLNRFPGLRGAFRAQAGALAAPRSYTPQFATLSL